MRYGSIMAILVLVILLLASSLARAQAIVQGPVSTGNRAVWEVDNAASVTAAAAFVPRFTIDQTGPISPSGTTCVAFVPATPNKFTCQVNLNAQMVALINIAGSHVVTLRLFDATTKLESPDSVPFQLSSPPAAPTGLRITG